MLRAASPLRLLGLTVSKLCVFLEPHASRSCCRQLNSRRVRQRRSALRVVQHRLTAQVRMCLMAVARPQTSPFFLFLFHCLNEW